ncbi:MAG: DUF4125 family protein [Deltaproteobacteria bacterium]|nr:DUF4125 family protein [Deltaproteobacteria bacterium]
MNRKTETIKKILDKEWYMFQRVKSLGGPAPCQSAPEAFRKIRGSIFETWSSEMLASYLEDLKRALNEGRNLLAEKYARMDGLIPPLSTNSLINKIVEIETRWQEEARKKYPAIYFRVGRGTGAANDGSNFSIYLRSELETYSDKTLSLYYERIRRALDKGENPAILSLETLVKKGGFKNLEHAENILARTC